MNFEDYCNLIETSDPDDWIINDEEGVYVLKKDLMISIRCERKEERDRFTEVWATKHPDSNAFIQRFFLCYGENTVDTFNTVSVDGNRAYIPYPSLTTMTITQHDYHLAQLINEACSGSLDEYLQRSGITVAIN